MYAIVFTRHAAKTLQRVPADRARLINDKIRTLAADPQSLAKNIAPPKGMPGCFRLRIGKWRVIYRVQREVIDVLEIVPRGGAYR